MEKLESRKGLIYGHFIYIYGIAIVLITLIVDILHLKNCGIFFIVAYIICAIVEYISIVASYRQKLRRRGLKPKNKYEEWIDKKYNDDKMKKIYANAKYVG